MKQKCKEPRAGRARGQGRDVGASDRTHIASKPTIGQPAAGNHLLILPHGDTVLMVFQRYWGDEFVSFGFESTLGLLRAGLEQSGGPGLNGISILMPTDSVECGAKALRRYLARITRDHGIDFRTIDIATDAATEATEWRNTAYLINEPTAGTA